MATKVKMNRAQREKRRRDIAAFVRRGNTYAIAAYAYGVSVSTVKKACQEEGVEQKLRMSSNTFAILKALLDGTSQAEVARHTGLTRSRISAIAAQAREAGFDV